MARPMPLDPPVMSAARSIARALYVTSLASRSVRKGAALIAVAALLVAGCGGGDDESDGEAPPPANAADFPEVGSQRLKDLLREAGSGPVLAPSAQEFRTGTSRVGFA